MNHDQASRTPPAFHPSRGSSFARASLIFTTFHLHYVCMADRNSHPMPPSGTTNGTAPTVLTQGSGGTLSSPLYSDYDRSNHLNLDDLCGSCDE